MEIFPGISIDPDVRFGKPCITGTRMDVATVLGLFAAGETIETVSSEYQLSTEQIRAALAYKPLECLPVVAESRTVIAWKCTSRPKRPGN